MNRNESGKAVGGFRAMLFVGMAPTMLGGESLMFYERLIVALGCQLDMTRHINMTESSIAP